MSFRIRLTITLLLTLFTFTIVALSSVVWRTSSQSSTGSSPGQGFGSGGGLKASKELEPIALDKVAKRRNAEAVEFEIISSATMRLPMAGKVAHQYSIRNKRDGSHHEVILDENGIELDRKQLLEAEAAANFAKYGKLDKDLAERLEKAEATELIPVQIETVESDDDDNLPKLPTMTSEQWNSMNEQQRKAHEDQEDEIMKQRREKIASRTKQLVDPVVKKLNKLGYECRIGEGTPIIYVSLNREMIKMVELWPETARISLIGVSKPQLQTSRVTIGANIVEARGVPSIRSVQTAVVDIGGSVAGNPYLTNTTQNFTNICQSVDAHATSTAGIINSVHSLQRGINPTAGVWAGGSCSGTDAELQTAIANAITFGAKVINCSFGYDNDHTSLRPFDNYLDRKVKNDRVTVVVSAGNYGTPCGGNGNIITPGKAYSIITVGAVNELGTTQWNDDEIWSCQSVTDPVSFFGDRVKPEVVAPGVDIRTTITGPPWVHVAPDPGLDGTSLAAPHVTGQVSLMIARARSLRHRPEVNKAIVISSNRLIFNYDRESQARAQSLRIGQTISWQECAAVGEK